jgi:hypothetical protein
VSDAGFSAYVDDASFGARVLNENTYHPAPITTTKSIASQITPLFIVKVYQREGNWMEMLTLDFSTACLDIRE